MKTASTRRSTGAASMSFAVTALLGALLLPVVIGALPEPISLHLFRWYVTAVLSTGILGVLVGASPRNLHPLHRMGIGMSILALASLYFMIYF
jgi:hypothetical protein